MQQNQINLNEVAREQVLTSIIAERDAAIIGMANTQAQMQAEIDNLKKEINELKPKGKK